MIRIFRAILLTLSITTVAWTAAQPTPVDVVYRSEYNIRGPWIARWLIAKLHPFDGSKYGKAFEYLRKSGLIDAQKVIRPEKVTDEQLHEVHTSSYVASLQKKSIVARIVEISLVKWLPNALVQRYILDPMRYATQGTILGAQRAVQTGGVVFNLGGGYHHAKADNGEGFCVFSDIGLAIKELWKTNPNLKIMVIDLDAHQGNGVASLRNTVFKDNPNLALFDMYNNHPNIYPHDKHAMREHIRYAEPLRAGIGTDEYLKVLTNRLPAAMNEFKPNFVLYNAGTDIKAGDPLGAMNVSERGIVQRDAFVIDTARARNIPTLVVTSGGYTQESAGIIARSYAGIISRLTGKQPATLLQVP